MKKRTQLFFGLVLLMTLMGSGLFANNAISFVGGESCYVNDGSNVLDVSNNWTFETWINIDERITWDCVLDRRGVITLYLTGDDIVPTGDYAVKFAARNSSDSVIASMQSDGSNVSMSFGEWYHVAITYDGVDAKFYINEVMVATDNDVDWDLNYASAGLNIGGRYWGSYSRQLNGDVDEVRVSNIARSIESMQTSVYDSPYTVDINTVLLMHFEDAGNPPTYETGAGLTGTIGDTNITSADYMDVSAELPMEAVLGCTDELALNYNPLATGDDGTCVYIEDAGNLFFSEYAEGSSYNKYLEIYNAGETAIDLFYYAFPNVSNAPTTPGEYEYWNNFTDGATIVAGDVYIIAHGSADDSILAFADETYSYLSNGDDGFGLVFGVEDNYIVLDWLGNYDGDPGSGWDVAGITNGTQDHTLVRKAEIANGNTDWSISAGTNPDNSEWIVLDNETWDYLGSHPHDIATNTAPFADNIDVTTDEDVAVEIILTGSDADGDELTFTVVTSPENGTYGDNVYTPNADWFGIDTFTYVANDGTVDSEIATVTITVNAINDAPILDQVASSWTDESIAVSFTLTATDIDTDDLNYSAISSSEYLTVEVTDDILTVTPSIGEELWDGLAEITITVSDGEYEDTGIRNFTDLAYFDNQQAIVLDGTKSFGVNDDADLLDISDNWTIECWINIDSRDGYDVVMDRRGVFTMALGAAVAEGDFKLNFFERDNDDGILRGLVSNDLMFETWYHITATFDGTTANLYVNGVLNDSEEDVLWSLSNSLNALNIGGRYWGGYERQLHGKIDEIRISDVAHKHFQISAISAGYETDENTIALFHLDDYNDYPSYLSGVGFNGTKLNDNLAADDYVSVLEELPLDGTNTSPTADNIEVTTTEDVAVEITLTGSDLEGDAVTFIVFDAPLNGNYVDGTYTPNVDWFGVDSFTFYATDGELDSQIATVTITVDEALSQPLAPTNVQIVVSVDDVGHVVRTISWDFAVGVDFYNIYACNTPDGEYIQINVEPIIETTFESVGASIMKFFRVTANNGGIVTSSKPAKLNSVK